MKRTPILWIALGVLAIVFALFQFAGVNKVRAQVDRDIQQSKSAFDTIDVQQAMGIVTFEPPRMLNPPDTIPPLLLYPPSAETLASLSGV